MIDQQIEIPTKDGHTTTLHHPSRARRAASRDPVLHGRAGDPRRIARHGTPARYFRLLCDAAEPVLPIGRHGDRPGATGSGVARKRMFQLMASINIPMVMEDTRALLDFAET